MRDRFRFILPVPFGIVTGAMVITISMSMTALIFHGKLAPFFHYGIGVSLSTIIVLNLVLAIGSSYPGVVSGPQSATSIIIATGILALCERCAYLDGDQRTYLLLIGYLFATAILTGLFLFFAGRFKLGKMTRFVPYPVYGGVLAGTGYLILKASIAFMVGGSDRIDSIVDIFSLPILTRWCPGVVFAIILFGASRTKHKVFLVPLLLFLSLPVFFICLWASRLSYETAAALGMVMQFGEFGGFNPLNLYQDIQHIDFSFILQQKGAILSVAFISSIALLFNLSSLELIAKDDIDLDRELLLSGCGNLLAGLCGGTVGYQMIAPSAFNHILGIKSRASNYIIIVMGLTILLTGTDLLRFFPVPLIGGYLLFIGLSFLNDYLWNGWKRMPLPDFLVVFSILMITILFGLIQGIAFGIVAAVFIFIVNYAKINIVKNTITGKFYCSNVERPQIEEDILRSEGEKIRAFLLSGYLFFGSAYSLYIKIKNYIHLIDSRQTSFIIIDFKDVQGIDSSAINSFFKIKQLLEKRDNVKLLFTRLKPKILTQLTNESILTPSDGDTVFTDIDRGFEWCEEQILKQNGITLNRRDHFNGVLETIFEDRDQINQFKTFLIPKRCKPEELLIKKGENSETLYFVERGQLSVVSNEIAKNAIRYRKIGSGSIVGEMGFFTNSKRTASVLADRESHVYELNATNQLKMEADAPEVALKFQKYVLKLLSKRLGKATQEFNSLFIDKTL
jgi:SulP family sulfate permease